MHMFALPCLLFQADCFVCGLMLRSNNVVENLCMRLNIGPAAAGPAVPVATALQCQTFYSTRLNTAGEAGDRLQTTVLITASQELK